MRFISAVLWTVGLYDSSLNIDQPVNPAIEIINMATLFTALYGLLTMQEALKHHLKVYHPNAKNLVLMVVILVSGLQKLALSIMVVNRAIPCVGTISPVILGNAIHHTCLIAEMLLFILLARFYFMKSLQKDLLNMQDIRVKAGMQSCNSVSQTTPTTVTNTPGRLGGTGLTELAPEAVTVAL